MIDLSVIIISYNEYAYLERAIKSCLRQCSEVNLEIIIGDDGSQDGSIDLIKKYSEEYPSVISYFVQERVIGSEGVIPSVRVSDIFKKAFAMSKGRYILLLSGDDFYHGDGFAKQIQFLNSNEKYSACYTDYRMVWPDKTEECSGKVTNRFLFWLWQYVHISCFVFRRDVVEKSILARMCDDTGLLYSIFQTGKVKRLKINTFSYTQREQSIMHSVDKLELCILDLMILQDITNIKRFSMSSYLKFGKSIWYVYWHRYNLRQDKYIKYFLSCEKYSNNLLAKLVNENKSIFEKMYCLLLVFLCRLSCMVVTVLKLVTLLFINIFGGK